MELKLNIEIRLQRLTSSSNCTFMELKFPYIKALEETM